MVHFFAFFHGRTTQCSPLLAACREPAFHFDLPRPDSRRRCPFFYMASKSRIFLRCLFFRKRLPPPRRFVEVGIPSSFVWSATHEPHSRFFFPNKPHVGSPAFASCSGRGNSPLFLSPNLGHSSLSLAGQVPPLLVHVMFPFFFFSSQLRNELTRLFCFIFP